VDDAVPRLSSSSEAAPAARGWPDPFLFDTLVADRDVVDVVAVIEISGLWRKSVD
jgi:hypothetical protein